MILAGIPAYNEEKTIARVILLTRKEVDMVVVCDDGSQDMTADIAEKLGAVVIKHDKNLGYGAAIRSIFQKGRELNADLVLTIDSDGQHSPEEIPRLLKPIQDGEADIVIGSRFLSKSDDGIPAYRRFGIKIITKMSNGSIKGKISDGQSGFRAYNRYAIQNLRLLENGMGASAEILMKASEQGFRIVEVPIGVKYEGVETSTHNPFTHALSVIATILKLIVEERPLFYLGIPGSVLFFAGAGLGIIFYYNYVTPPGHFLPGILFSSIALTLVGSLTLFAAVTLYAILRLTQKIQSNLKEDS